MRGADRVFESRGFGLGDLTPPRREAVISATPAVSLTAIGLDDPSVDHHLFEVAIERGRREAHGASRHRLDLLTDRIPVPLTLGHREQCVKRARAEREERRRVGCGRHGVCTSGDEAATYRVHLYYTTLVL